MSTVQVALCVSLTSVVDHLWAKPMSPSGSAPSPVNVVICRKLVSGVETTGAASPSIVPTWVAEAYLCSAAGELPRRPQIFISLRIEAGRQSERGSGALWWDDSLRAKDHCTLKKPSGRSLQRSSPFTALVLLMKSAFMIRVKQQCSGLHWRLTARRLRVGVPGSGGGGAWGGAVSLHGVYTEFVVCCVWQLWIICVSVSGNGCCCQQCRTTGSGWMRKNQPIVWAPVGSSVSQQTLTLPSTKQWHFFKLKH